MTDFRRLVNSRRLDAKIALGQQREREHRREYRDGLSDEMARLKKDLAQVLEACPFPAATGLGLFRPSVQEEWQRALDTIDPKAGDGTARLKQVLAQVQAYRDNTRRPRPLVSADLIPTRTELARRETLIASLDLIEVHLESLIRYAEWWRTA